MIVGVPSGRQTPSLFPNAQTKLHECEECRSWGRLHLGRQFAIALRQAVEQVSDLKSCIIHDHGVWLATNHAVAKTCRQIGVQRVVSPRGMVGRWAMSHGKWKKRLAWWAYQRADLLRADAFHATSAQEAEELRALGCYQPIAVIPNGLSYPESLPIRRPKTGFHVLFMSRIHPKKGLMNLLAAWKKANLPSDWRLLLAGPDEGGHQQMIADEAKRLGLSDSISFLGPIADEEKWQVYVDADLFVLPSFNENFGIVVTEAMYAGLPVITTTGTPWSVLNERKCGWWVEPDVMSLRDAMEQASRLSQAELEARGDRAHKYVRETFSWQQSAAQMKIFYEWLLTATGSTPPFVALSKRELCR